MRLGVIVLLPLAIVLVLRKLLAHRFVETAPYSRRPRRQFLLEMAAMLTAGAATVAYLAVVYYLPAGTAVKVIMGYTAFGFFLAIDMALQRERDNINAATRDLSVPSMPVELFPMTRKFLAVAMGAAFLTCMIVVFVVLNDIQWLRGVEQRSESLEFALLSVIYEVVFIIVTLLLMCFNLILSFSANLKLLFSNQTGVLDRVSRGDLTKMVPVATHDEFGVIAGHTNMMIQGLRQRLRLLSALKVAEEVQQNLLPAHPPAIEAADIAGTSIYCDRVGGDYYDYVSLPGGRTGVLVADAAGHGVGAAVYMAGMRAFLRSGFGQYDNPAKLLSDVNQYLAADSLETGRFATLFFLEIDAAHQRLRWVRAGHEPAILYDPAADRFDELSGKGVALGAVPEAEFRLETREGWQKGSIVVIGTDGIHETTDPAGRMFGIDGLKNIVRKVAALSAQKIRDAVVEQLQTYRAGSMQTDDVTLVVVKLL